MVRMRMCGGLSVTQALSGALDGAAAVAVQTISLHMVQTKDHASLHCCGATAQHFAAATVAATLNSCHGNDRHNHPVDSILLEAKHVMFVRTESKREI